MEIMAYILCFAAGAVLVMVARRDTVGRQRDKPKSGHNNLTRQFDNLLAYKGSGEGQKQLED